jgi:hypothetical protein
MIHLRIGAPDAPFQMGRMSRRKPAGRLAASITTPALRASCEGLCHVCVMVVVVFPEAMAKSLAV